MNKETLMEYLKGLLEDAKNERVYTNDTDLIRLGKVLILEEIIQELEG